MSATVLVPPRTRFDSGHEMNAASGSMSVTSIAPSLHIRTYFAAVAPPYPPPITTTLPRAALAVVAQPGRYEAAAAVPLTPPSARRNSRRRIDRVLPRRFLCGEPAGERVDLLIGVALRELVHDRRGPRA